MVSKEDCEHLKEAHRIMIELVSNFQNEDELRAQADRIRILLNRINDRWLGCDFLPKPGSGD
jgi:hypothetical protein